MPPLSLAVAADDAPATPRPHLQHLLDQAEAQGPIPVAVAYPCDAGSLQAAMQAAQAGLITPLLVGPEARIQAAAQAAGLDLAGASIHSTADDPRAAAAQAAALCGSGQARALMKGSLHSDELLGAAVAREAGLRGGRRASHVFVMDLPGYDRPLLMTDCVVNIFPTLMDKRDIAQNAIDLAHAIGIPRPRMAVLSAVETVNPAIPGTIDAAALCKMADRGQISGALLDGPLAYDNVIYKQLVYMADAECAGLVLGMRVPIVLTSRSDSVASRIASCALAVLVSAAGGKERS
jgi:phosphate acetyltransferase